MSPVTTYAELACTSSYSFLRGASPPSDYMAEGIRLGLTAVGIADRNTVSGVVRAWKALRDAPDDARSALLAAKRDAGEPETLSEAEDAACEVNIRLSRNPAGVGQSHPVADRGQHARHQGQLHIEVR
jgi:error-prone DNA polymerase